MQRSMEGKFINLTIVSSLYKPTLFAIATQYLLLTTLITMGKQFTITYGYFPMFKIPGSSYTINIYIYIYIYINMCI